MGSGVGLNVVGAGVGLSVFGLAVIGSGTFCVEVSGSSLGGSSGRTFIDLTVVAGTPGNIVSTSTGIDLAVFSFGFETSIGSTSCTTGSGFLRSGNNDFKSNSLYSICGD